MMDPTISIDEDVVLATCTGMRVGPTEAGAWITATDRTGRFKLRFRTTKSSPGIQVFQDKSDTPAYHIELGWGNTVGIRENRQGRWEAVFKVDAIRGVMTPVEVA